MKRTGFLKRLFGGVAAIVATPSILEAAKDEVALLVNGRDEYIDTNFDPSKNLDGFGTVEFKSDGTDPKVYINGVESEIIDGGEMRVTKILDKSAQRNHFVQNDPKYMPTIK